MNLENHETSELSKIIDKVARYYRLTVDELLSTSRSPRISHPRMLAMFLVRRDTDHSLKEISDAFGMKDHASVCYANKRISEAIRDRPSLNETIKKILAGDDPAQLKLKLEL